MKTIFLLSAQLLFAVLPGQGFAQISDSLVLALMDQYDVSGLSLAVVHGDSVWTSGWGYADAERHIEVTPDTPFRIASVAKVFVAATVVTEVSRGTIGLRDDLSDLIPRSDRFQGPITLHDLLTHTAGFDERLVGYAARTSDEMRPLGEYLAERMPPRGWPAGEQISYSNHGMALAAFAVEQARGESFSELATSDVFAPLGMRSTFFLTRGGSVPPRSADPLSCEENECNTLPHIFSHTYPAGLAFSTAHDMSRFISAILNAEDAESPLKELIPARFTLDRRIAGMSYGFFNQYHHGIRFLAHAGSVPGYWSLLLISPDANLGFFFASNGGSERFGERFRDELLAIFLGDTPVNLPEPSKSEEPSVRSGIYELNRYSHETIERFPQAFVNSIMMTADADTLLLVAGGRVKRYVQIEEDLYENLDGSDRIAFGVLRGEPHLFRSSFVYGAGVPASYEKRSWRRAPGFLNEYASWLLGGPVFILFIVWPVSAAVDSYRRRKRGKGKPPQSRISGSVSFFATVTVVLFAVFGFGFVARSNRMLQSGELLYGMPDSLVVFSWIPLVHAVLTALICAAFVMAWKNSWWNLTRRLLFTVVTVSLILQVAFLVTWNYLPISW